MALSSEEVIRQAMISILEFEGGATYTDDPDDAGGPTKFGVALNFNRDVIPDKNGDGRITAEDVKLLDKSDALGIFRTKYWDRNGCDALPPPLAFEYVDMVVNPGPGAAPKLLQRALRGLGADIAVDGRVGPRTLAAIDAFTLRDVITRLADERILYYRSRPKFWKYGRGWTRRATLCRDRALALLDG